MTILTIYIISEFIIGIGCILAGIGLIYVITQIVANDKGVCAFMAFMCFMAATGLILGSMQRPSPTKQDVMDGTAVYISDTVVGNGEKVVFYDIVWKDKLPNDSIF